MKQIIDQRRLESAGGPSSDNPKDYEVTSIPNLSTPLPSKQYAGHITVDEKNKGKIFYWLFEASTSPQTAPLIIWLSKYRSWIRM